MLKGVRPKTLQNKCNTWAKRLRLGDWTITCKYATKPEMDKVDPEDGSTYFDENTIGCLMECSIPEKIAVIGIRRNYFDHDGYKVSWNLDTLIIHELIHIIEKVGKKNSGIPKKIDRRRDFTNFEEYNCDAFAAIIYYMYYDHI